MNDDPTSNNDGPDPESAGKALEIPDGYEFVQRIFGAPFADLFLAKRVEDERPVIVRIWQRDAPVPAYDVKHQLDLWAGLQHPNVVQILEHGRLGGRPYSVTEYCENGSADALAQQNGGRLPFTDALPIVIGALSGLDYVHRQGIVHRDLKPANIELKKGPKGWIAKLSNFFLAERYDSRVEKEPADSAEYFSGTIAFMSREQLLENQNVLPTADVWSMGATLYNLLTGRLPYEFTTFTEGIPMILEQDVVPVTERGVFIPAPLTRIVTRALAHPVEDRFRSAAEFRDALASIL